MDWSTSFTPALGATGLLAVVVLMLLRGALMSRRQVDDLLKIKDEQIAMWRTALERSEEAHRHKDRQIAALMEAGRTTTQVLQAVHQVAGSSNERGGHVPSAPEDH